MYWVCIHVPILDHTTKSTLKINLKYYKIQYLYPNIFFKYRIMYTLGITEPYGYDDIIKNIIKPNGDFRI